MLGFGLIFELKNQFSAEASQIERSLSNLTGSSKHAEKQFDIMMNSMNSGFALLRAGTTLLSSAGSSITAAAELEQQQMAFRTMLGDAGKARAMIKDIQAFAAATPYETPEITRATKQLLAYGFAQQELIPTMRTLGDVASGLNIPLGQLSYLYGTVRTAGYAGLIDIRQFANRGIPIWEELSRVTGRTVKDLTSTRGLKIPFAQVEEAFRNMTSEGGKFYNMMEAQSGTYNGLVSTFKDNLTFVKQEFGNILLPYLKQGVRFFINFAQAAAEFAKTPLGKVLFVATMGLGLLLTVLGALTITMAGARFMSLSLSNTFMSMGKTAIANAFAVNGLTGGLKMLALSAWQAMIPFLPYIAIGVAIFGVFMLIKNALSSFNEYANGTASKGSGLLLFMQRLGGVVQSLITVWNSWDGNSFNLGGMENRLAELGILDLVVNLSTWIIRIKEMFSGMFSAFATIFKAIGNVVSSVFNVIKSAIRPLLNVIFEWVPWLNKTTSSINEWRAAGQVLAGFLTGVMVIAVGALIIKMWALASAVIAATWPFLLIIGLIYGVYMAFTNWGAITQWVSDLWGSFTNYLAIKFNQFTEWFFALPSRFVNWGMEMVENIKNGILGAWESFKGWFLSKILEIPGMDMIFEAAGISTGPNAGSGMAGAMFAGITPQGQTTQMGGMFNLNEMAQQMAKQKAQQMAGGNTNVTVNTPEQQQQEQKFTFVFGDEEITKIVNKKNENNQRRRDG
ncbi:MAG: tape measure protein [Raineya sp.]|jgi:hypothetical protein|nr:tape measure protein [Raineya sp.]